MARWKVTAPHYVHAEQFGQPTEWAREETNRETGRTFRKTLKVPMLVDPNDSLCVNRITGMCVVATQGSEQPGDIVFFGPPTPDMEPLDDEARAITEAEKPKWKSPINDLPVQIGEDFAQQLLQVLERRFLDAKSKQEQPVSLSSASASDLAELKALVLAQQEQIKALLGNIAQPVADAPLEDINPEASSAPPPAAPPRQGLRRA